MRIWGLSHEVSWPDLTKTNIRAAPAYGVKISQLIRYSGACSSYQDFLDRRLLLLTRKLLNHGFLLAKLKSSLRKSYGRHHDLLKRYEISMSQMTTDMFITVATMTCLSVTKYLCHKWPRICSVCSNHNQVLSLYMNYHRVCSKINTTDATYGSTLWPPFRNTEKKQCNI